MTMTPVTGSTVTIRPITDDDVERVGRVLCEDFTARVPTPSWAAAMTADWHEIAPNHGCLLEDDGVVVGAYVAYYTRRNLGGVERDVCNLGAWCVLDRKRG